MKIKTIEDIKLLQKMYGYEETQVGINSGLIWKMEGSQGRHAMDCLRTGRCFLPLESFRDYYGNIIPTRKEVKEGSAGSLSNSIQFWDRAINEGLVPEDLFYY